MVILKSLTKTLMLVTILSVVLKLKTTLFPMEYVQDAGR
jgi:hypothetical protein